MNFVQSLITSKKSFSEKLTKILDTTTQEVPTTVPVETFETTSSLELDALPSMADTQQTFLETEEKFVMSVSILIFFIFW